LSAHAQCWTRSIRRSARADGCACRRRAMALTGASSQDGGARRPRPSPRRALGRAVPV